jgi:hypothetical protein
VKEKGADDSIAREQMHNNFSIIDRFIRALRDYLRKNKPITDSKINPILKTYNKTIYQTSGVSPTQMQDNKDFEGQHIIESLNKQNQIEVIAPHYKLNINDKERLIEHKKTFKKIRYNVSLCYYTITAISDKSIVIKNLKSLHIRE